MERNTKHAIAVLLAYLLTSGLLCACDQLIPPNNQLVGTPTMRPTSTPANALDVTMYKPVIDQSFSHLTQTFRSYEIGTIEHVHPHEVYITPTFGDKANSKVPTEIIDAILHFTNASGLTRIMTDEVGSLIVAVSLPSHDADPRGLVIFVETEVKGYECATFLSIGYLLTKTPTGWKADAITMGEC